ncbi:MAG: hypothetical protein ACRDHW_13310, partial [Ktedonobacteraceae bacterium]
MPSFDDRPDNIVRPLFDLKQVTPHVEAGSGGEHARISSPLSTRTEQEPVTPALSSPAITRQFATMSTPKVTRQLTLEPGATRQSVVAPTPRITRQLTAASLPSVTRQLT